MTRETPWCLQREKIRWMESCERYLVSVRHERVEVVNACVANKVPAVEWHGIRKIVGGSQGVKTPRTSQIFVLIVSVKSGATSVPRWVAQTTGATWIVNAASWIGQRQ